MLLKLDIAGVYFLVQCGYFALKQRVERRTAHNIRAKTARARSEGNIVNKNFVRYYKFSYLVYKFEFVEYSNSS